MTNMTGKLTRVLFGFGLLAFLAASVAQANVSLKNGNFFMGYTDVVYPGGFEPKIERVYNSKTPFRGIFGHGWGNEYEVYMTVSADGSVVVHEYGGGAENRFSPVGFKVEELDKACGMLTDTAKGVGAFGGADQANSYRNKCKTDAYFRNEEWKKFLSQGKVKPRQLANGSQLHSNRFSYQYITKVQSGYVRAFDSGRAETFDESGKLVKISDKNGNFIEFSYAKDGKLQKLADNFNRKMFFTFNNRGLLEKIQGENSKESQYWYNEKDELVKSKDVDSHVYEYFYGKQNHYMTEIRYQDKTKMEVAYFDKDKNESVKSVKDRDGTLTEYGYDIDPKDKGHFSVSVAVKSPDGKPLTTSSYEYYMKRKNDGEEWTYKMISTVDGEKTETTYNECCGLPLIIKKGVAETLFEYDAKGHVTKKTTPNEITDLKYDPNVGKVTKVARYSKKDKKQINWSEFQYDPKGNLVFAKNSEGKGVKLIYDMNGRIKSMVDQARKQINFKYDQQTSKPIEISDPSVGTITVTYTNSGEIKKVESSAGRKIAMQVTTAFQNLLDIIRPAGVSLSF